MKRYTFGQRLNQAMQIRNTKQVDVIQACQIVGKPRGIKMGVGEFSQYVNGKVLPRSNKLELIAEVLNVSEPWLWGYDVPMER